MIRLNKLLKVMKGYTSFDTLSTYAKSIEPYDENVITNKMLSQNSSFQSINILSPRVKLQTKYQNKQLSSRGTNKQDNHKTVT